MELCTLRMVAAGTPMSGWATSSNSIASLISWPKPTWIWQSGLQYPSKDTPAVAMHYLESVLPREGVFARRRAADPADQSSAVHWRLERRKALGARGIAKANRISYAVCWSNRHTERETGSHHVVHRRLLHHGAWHLAEPHGGLK